MRSITLIEMCVLPKMISSRNVILSDTIMLHLKLTSVLRGMIHEVLGTWTGTWVVGCEEERGNGEEEPSGSCD